MSRSTRNGGSLAAAASLLVMILGAAAVRAEPTVNPLGLEPHHVTAAANDIDRAVRWYTTVLGFALDERGVRDNGAFEFAKLSIPGFVVALVHVRVPGAPAAAPVGAHAETGWIHVVFSVADPDALFRALKERGADVWQRAPVPPGPVTTFLMHDSEGNQIEIVERPGKGKT